MHTRIYCLLVLLLVLVRTSAQQPVYTNLVFEGGGIRGIAYAGAVQELEQNGSMQQIQRTGGTSAGAIISLLVALKYSATDITHIVYNTQFQQFNDGHFIFIGGIARMRKNYGWYKGDAFMQWLGKLIKDKTGNADITFAELHAAGYRDLYVTATSLSRQKLLVFSYEHYPNMRIKDAVRFSMSIPFYFESTWIDSNGQVVKNPELVPNADLVVDGGIAANFPIQLFDSVVLNGTCVTRICNKQTLGVRLDNDTQIVYDQRRAGLAPVQIKSFTDYITAFYSYTIENLNRTMLVEDDWKRTIALSSSGIGPKVKKLSDAQKNLLIESGRRGVKDFFKGAR